MKLLTIAVPCYNSQDYVERCIESLLPGGAWVEILLINDGSTDGTKQILEGYETKFPDMVRVIDQENGGHGAAVNAGLRAAEGIYFKVVDSDDWVKEEAYLRILGRLQELIEGDEMPDLAVSNFVYEKQGAKRGKVMHFRHAFPKERIFGWEDIRRLRKGQYMLMHSVIFRTGLLRECGLELPEHTFYVDNLFVFEPLPYVKKLYYMDVNFYRYFIGREDQSVNEQVMISRIDQQILVNKRMIDYLTDKGRMRMDRRAKQYMTSYLDIVTTVSSILLIRAGNKESLAKKKELWSYLKQKDFFLYYKLRHGLLGSLMNLPGKGGRRVAVETYKIGRRIFKFN